MSRCNTFTCMTNQRGTAMLEMAIALPIFLGLLLAIVDFGNYFNARSVLLSAAYNCSKAAASNGCSAPTNYTTIIKDSIGKIILNPEEITIDPTYASPDVLPSGPLDFGTPIQRYRVTLGYNSSPLSAFTSTLGLYPIAATGVAHCP